MNLSQLDSEAKSLVSCPQGCGGSHNQNREADDDEIPAPTSSYDGRNNTSDDQTSTLLGLLSSELNKLSVQERSRALEDLHCVGNGLEESSEMMKQSLEEFDRILKQRSVPVYEQAAKQNCDYVEDTAFRLMFLRSNQYDVAKAVSQMVNHLELKAKYFGEDKVGRDITVDDLSSEEMELLSSGTLLVLEEKDPTGRAIVCCMGSLMGQWRLEALVSCCHCQ